MPAFGAARRVAKGLFALLVLWPAAPLLADPTEVFSRAAPSVVVVARAWSRPYATDGRPVDMLGSGVIVEAGQVITNCHVAGSGSGLMVRHGATWLSATLRYADRPRDLCQLELAGLDGQPARRVASRSLKVGQRVYSIGAPMGLELSLGEGLISALRVRGTERYIQTSATISQGFSGGGLFDEQGRLIGITTFYIVGGQGLNFALPADWVAELPRRSQLATARPPLPASPDRRNTGAMAPVIPPPGEGESSFGQVFW